MPQGSVLGPVLFILYVNELPALVKSKLKLFADDSKFYRIIQDTSDVALLQKDLDTLVKWTDHWLLRFNVSKCKVMHCGHSNLEAEYFLNEANGESKTVEVTRLEKDSGIYVPETLKPTLHCKKAANKGMSALRLLRNAFVNLTLNKFRLLYMTYVRSHLEYNLLAVVPYMRQDFNALEKVQRRATKLVKEIKHLPYPERLRRLGLSSIEERVLRGDLIETYKLLTGKINVDPKQLFNVKQPGRTRGHRLKLEKHRPTLMPDLNYSPSESSTRGISCLKKL